MQILITGRGLDLTGAIEEYVIKKLEGLGKFFSDIIRANVLVGQETHHHLKGEIFFAECKLEVSGHDVFCKETAKSLYEAIDMLRDHLAADLKKHKAKLSFDGKKEKVGARQNKEYTPD